MKTETESNLVYKHDLFKGEAFQLFYSFTQPLIRENLRSGDVLIDLGCGDGLLTINLAETVPLKRAFGIDIREEVISQAKAYSQDKKNCEFYCENAENLDFLKRFGNVDAILARTSLHHFKNPVESLLELSKQLNKNGRLIVVDIDCESSCFTLFGFPLSLLITWFFVAKKIGIKNVARAIRAIKYPSKEWREHRAQDHSRWKKIGWYRFRDIRRKLQSAFPESKVGRLASFLGFGGVYYFIYEKNQDD